jgi:hypothetical protein
MRNSIADERKKLDTIVEGRCQAFTIDIERKILQKMNAIMTENQALRDEMINKLEKANKEQD